MYFLILYSPEIHFYHTRENAKLHTRAKSGIVASEMKIELKEAEYAGAKWTASLFHSLNEPPATGLLCFSLRSQ